MNQAIEELQKKPYAPIMEIVNAYGVSFGAFNKYISESKVKMLKRGKRLTYKTTDVHIMLSERGYPKLKRTKKASIGVEALVNT